MIIIIIIIIIILTSDFGWDWGPAFVPAGIPCSVQLFASDVGQLTTVRR
jgi:hypothetical protein